MILEASLAFALLVGAQPQPGSVADLTSRPLWIVSMDDGTLSAIDIPPASATPSAPVPVTFWLFLPMEDGFDTMAGALIVDCSAGNFVTTSFSGFSGATYLGTSVATNTQPQAIESGTFYGAMLDHVCVPTELARPAPDLTDFTQGQPAFQSRRAGG